MRPEIDPAVLQSGFCRKRRNGCGAVYGRVKSECVLFSNRTKLKPGGGIADEIMDGTKCSTCRTIWAAHRD